MAQVKNLIGMIYVRTNSIMGGAWIRFLFQFGVVWNLISSTLSCYDFGFWSKFNFENQG